MGRFEAIRCARAPCVSTPFRRLSVEIVISPLAGFDSGGWLPPRLYGGCATPVAARGAYVPLQPESLATRPRSLRPRESRQNTPWYISTGVRKRLGSGPVVRPRGAV